jgi:hypothetical protein
MQRWSALRTTSRPSVKRCRPPSPRGVQPLGPAGHAVHIAGLSDGARRRIHAAGLVAVAAPTPVEQPAPGSTVVAPRACLDAARTLAPAVPPRLNEVRLGGLQLGAEAVVIEARSSAAKIRATRNGAGVTDLEGA